MSESESTRIDEGDNHKTDFSQFVAQCQPLIWGSRTEMDLQRWFEWPPDVFALTSLVLGSTGAYRRAASPPNGQLWPPPRWPSRAGALGGEWRNWVASGCNGRHPLADEYMEKLNGLCSVPLDDLYDCETVDSWELCRLMLELLGISDEAMRGVGIAFSPLASEHQIFPRASVDSSGELSFFYLQANFLLALRGSLSRLPKYRGIVLPKSRTPQVGLTLRSFSNNLTFHETEVDVAWRSFPWLNTDENIVNIMVVPWPFQVEAGCFSAVHPAASSYLGQARYFHYMPEEKSEEDVSILVGYLRAVKREVHRVHIMVFPELALGRKSLSLLKRKLEACLLPTEIPMIVSGVSSKFQDFGKIEYSNAAEPNSQPVDPQTARHLQIGPQARGTNRIVLSLYYAGKWHDVVQDKHHRWRIDDNQIEQYGLGGVLSGGRIWWEAIQIVRRRLSVLAANSWLTICPLICEDLARLDPVSELIRGVGPSLLTAILLDGPQLRSRWSARYASVFADDPGSSVLTLTSLGMSLRSTPSGRLDAAKKEKTDEASRTIALWKDQEKGWFPVSVDKGEVPVKILTLSALLQSESSFDGRFDEESTAAFSFQGLVQHSVPGEFSDLSDWLKDNDKSASAEEIGKMDLDENSLHVDKDEKRADARRKKLKILDMCELTLFTYFVDAIVDHRSDLEALRSWFNQAVRLKEKRVAERCNGSRLGEELISFLVHSIEKRDLVPREVPTPHLVYAISLVTDLVEVVRSSLKSDGVDLAAAEEIGTLLKYWNRLVSEAIARMASICRAMSVEVRKKASRSSLEKESLDKSKELNKLFGAGDSATKKLRVEIRPHEIGRLRLMTPLALLWAVHARLSARRRFGALTADEIRLMQKVESEASGETFHGVYLDWRHSMKKKYPRKRTRVS